MESLFKIYATPPPEHPCVGDTNFKEHYPHVHKSMSWNVLEVSIKQVTRDLIVPYLTEDYYNELAGKYNGPDPHLVLTNLDNKIIEYLQDAIAHYVIWKDAVPRSIAIGDIGTVTAKGKEGMANPVEAWRLSHFYWTTMKSADAYLDKAIAYLEKNLNDFPTYKNSREELARADFFVNTTSILEEHFSIMGSHRTFMALIPSLKKAHNHIYQLLGSNQFEDLLLGYKAQNNTLNNAYLSILGLIQEYCSIFAIWQAIPRLDVIVQDNAVVVVTSLEGMLRSVQQAQANRIDALRCELEVQYKEAYKKLEGCLRLNRSSYPIWSDDHPEDFDDNDGIPYSFGAGGIFLM